MMTIELLPLSEILAEIIEMLVGCFIGWLIIERIRLFVKCVKQNANGNNNSAASDGGFFSCR